MRKLMVVGGVAALVACGAGQSAVSRVVGDGGEALHDAGQWLADAGDSMSDAGARADDDAQAQSEKPVLNKSGSRIEMRVALQRGDDGSVFSYGAQPYDTKRGEKCSPSMAADGKVRCLPTSQNAVRGYFSDPSCASELAAIVTLPCGDSAAYAGLAEFLADTCPSTGLRVFALGTKHTGVVYRVNAIDSCVAVDRGALSFFQMDDEIPLSSFVEFTSAGNAIL